MPLWPLHLYPFGRSTLRPNKTFFSQARRVLAHWARSACAGRMTLYRMRDSAEVWTQIIVQIRLEDQWRVRLGIVRCLVVWTQIIVQIRLEDQWRVRLGIVRCLVV